MPLTVSGYAIIACRSHWSLKSLSVPYSMCLLLPIMDKEDCRVSLLALCKEEAPWIGSVFETALLIIFHYDFVKHCFLDLKIIS